MANKDKLIQALEQVESKLRKTCFNPDIPTSVPTAAQDEVLRAIGVINERYAVGGNQSGKTNLGGRECSWVFEGNHPYWSPPQDRPLIQLVVGVDHKNILESVWSQKIEPFLEPGTYHQRMEGNALHSVTHKKNGNKILFFSHKSPRECRKSVQGYVADWTWLDEMPSDYSLLTELHTRCQTNSAPFLATFTPLLRSAKIKNHVENGTFPTSKKFILYTYENPVYTGKQISDMKARHALLSDGDRATRTTGAWYAGDNAVYDFLSDLHVEEPVGYSAEWRHIDIIDPAASGKSGLILLAEDPCTNVWYAVKEAYAADKSPSGLIEVAKDFFRGINVVEHVSDTMAWYRKHAAEEGIWYTIPHNKSNKKPDLIKGLQEALSSGKLKIAPWCYHTMDEFTTCQWNEAGISIINAKRYHLLDCLQYGIERLPAVPIAKPEITRYQAMVLAHKERIAREAAQLRTARSRRKGQIARIMPVKRRSRIWR